MAVIQFSHGSNEYALAVGSTTDLELVLPNATLVRGPELIELLDWLSSRRLELLRPLAGPLGLGTCPDEQLCARLREVVRTSETNLYLARKPKQVEGSIAKSDPFVAVTDPVQNAIDDAKPAPKRAKKRLLYLLFYVTKNADGDDFFAEAAQTRLQNIKASQGYDSDIHKVHCPPIQDISETIAIVARYIKMYGGTDVAFCKEIGVFSHSALDGPIGTVQTAVEPLDIVQMGMAGWEIINFNWWPEKPMFVVYGCNSANESLGLPRSFASNLSKLPNFANVEVWGQSTSSFPSFLPDYRVTSVARSMDFGWDVAKTYQVGGGSGEGWDAIGMNPLKFDFPRATPMNCYLSGARVRSTHQGFYNDHRKSFVLVTV